MKYPVLLSPSFCRGMAALAALSISAFLNAQSYTAERYGRITFYDISDNGIAVGQRQFLGGYAYATSSAYGTSEEPSGGEISIASLAGGSSCYYGINNHDTIVGGYNDSTFGAGAFTRNYGDITSTDLGVVGCANGINDAGTVVGWCSGGTNKIAFSYSSGVFSILGIPEGGTDSRAYAINNSGTIVGGWDNMGMECAFVYSGGVMTDLSALMGGLPGAAYDINDAGVIVGDRLSNAFIYSAGVYTLLVPSPIGPSAAYGINNSGAVVGCYTAPEMVFTGDTHAFIYSSGVITDLNTLVTLADGDYLTEARAINNYGQIVANSYYGDAYILTPIPESSTWAALCGLAALGFAAVRRRKG